MQIEIRLAGRQFVALSSRALYWPARKTVFVADVHLGKAAAFRARSIPLPHGTTQATLVRLGQVLAETQAEQMVVLGDLWHDRLGRSDNLLDRLTTWTKTHPTVRFTLITGNHDVKAGATPPSTGFVSVDELCIECVCCLHHPVPREEMYVLAGHVHPAIDLGSAGSSLKLPCFTFGKRVGILPAFGEFTGTVGISPEPEDQVFAVAENRLFQIPTGQFANKAARTF